MIYKKELNILASLQFLYYDYNSLKNIIRLALILLFPNVLKHESSEDERISNLFSFRRLFDAF